MFHLIAVFCLTFFISLVTLLPLLHPSIPAGDAGELMAVATSGRGGSFGLAHPPGYPLFAAALGMYTRVMTAFVDKEQCVASIAGASSVFNENNNFNNNNNNNDQIISDCSTLFKFAYHGFSAVCAAAAAAVTAVTLLYPHKLPDTENKVPLFYLTIRFAVLVSLWVNFGATASLRLATEVEVFALNQLLAACGCFVVVFASANAEFLSTQASYGFMFAYDLNYFTPLFGGLVAGLALCNQHALVLLIAPAVIIEFFITASTKKHINNFDPKLIRDAILFLFGFLVPAYFYVFYVKNSWRQSSSGNTNLLASGFVFGNDDDQGGGAGESENKNSFFLSSIFVPPRAVLSHLTRSYYGGIFSFMSPTSSFGRDDETKSADEPNSSSSTSFLLSFLLRILFHAAWLASQFCFLIVSTIAVRVASFFIFRHSDDYNDDEKVNGEDMLRRKKKEEEEYDTRAVIVSSSRKLTVVYLSSILLFALYSPAEFFSKTNNSTTPSFTLISVQERFWTQSVIPLVCLVGFQLQLAVPAATTMSNNNNNKTKRNLVYGLFCVFALISLFVFYGNLSKLWSSSSSSSLSTATTADRNMAFRFALSLRRAATTTSASSKTKSNAKINSKEKQQQQNPSKTTESTHSNPALLITSGDITFAPLLLIDYLLFSSSSSQSKSLKTPKRSKRSNLFWLDSQMASNAFFRRQLEQRWLRRAEESESCVSDGEVARVVSAAVEESYRLTGRADLSIFVKRLQEDKKQQQQQQQQEQQKKRGNSKKRKNTYGKDKNNNIAEKPIKIFALSAPDTLAQHASLAKSGGVRFRPVGPLHEIFSKEEDSENEDNVNDNENNNNGEAGAVKCPLSSLRPDKVLKEMLAEFREKVEGEEFSTTQFFDDENENSSSVSSSSLSEFLRIQKSSANLLKSCVEAGLVLPQTSTGSTNKKMTIKRIVRLGAPLFRFFFRHAHLLGEASWSVDLIRLAGIAQHRNFVKFSHLVQQSCFLTENENQIGDEDEIRQRERLVKIVMLSLRGMYRALMKRRDIQNNDAQNVKIQNQFDENVWRSAMWQLNADEVDDIAGPFSEKFEKLVLLANENPKIFLQMLKMQQNREKF